jgi:hypothetical protein
MKVLIYFIGRRIMVARVLIISDKFIEEDVRWQINPNRSTRYKVKKTVV